LRQNFFIFEEKKNFENIRTRIIDERMFRKV